MQFLLMDKQVLLPETHSSVLLTHFQCTQKWDHCDLPADHGEESPRDGRGIISPVALSAQIVPQESLIIANYHFYFKHPLNQTRSTLHPTCWHRIFHKHNTR